MEEMRGIDLFMGLDDSVIISLANHGELEEFCMALSVEMHSKPSNQIYYC